MKKLLAHILTNFGIIIDLKMISSGKIILKEKVKHFVEIDEDNMQDVSVLTKIGYIDGLAIVGPQSQKQVILYLEKRKKMILKC